LDRLGPVNGWLGSRVCLLSKCVIIAKQMCFLCAYGLANPEYIRSLLSELMLVQLRAAIKLLRKELGVSRSSATLEKARKFLKLFGAPAGIHVELARCNHTMDAFCEFFGKGSDDVAFRDVYTRDLAFRNTWLDFLDSLLVYMKSLDAAEPIASPEFNAYVLQTQTTLGNARRQSNIQRKDTDSSTRNRGPTVLGHFNTDEDTLYNMRDILKQM
jgi:hypothetical protein